MNEFAQKMQNKNVSNLNTKNETTCTNFIFCIESNAI